MNQESKPSHVLECLARDPSLAFLGKTFACTDNLFSDPDRVVNTFGCVPMRQRKYTLIEIHFTTSGFAGNFLELPPADARSGFFLRRFRPLHGIHPDLLLRSEQAADLTRARFGTTEYGPPGVERFKYADLIRPVDGLPVTVYGFDPALLDWPLPSQEARRPRQG